VTCWHQTAWIRARDAHLTAALTGLLNAGHQTARFESSMSAAWPGLSAGIAVVDVEGNALVSRSETAHKVAMAAESGSGRPRPAHRRTARFTQRGVEGKMGPPALANRPHKRVIQ
jgi:hypothetical protein